MKIAWVVDSASCLYEPWSNHPDVYILPLSVITCDGPLKENVEISHHQLCERLERNEEMSTSQPAIGETVELMKKLKGKYDVGVPLLLSSKLSGTYQGTVQAADIAEFPLLPFETYHGLAGIHYLLEQGIQLMEAHTPEEILIELEKARDQLRVGVMIGSLDRLKKSGRLGSTSAAIGELLRIKPIVELQNGSLEVTAKIRTEKKALFHLANMVVSSLDPSCQTIYIMQARAVQQAFQLEMLLKEQISCKIISCPLSSVIAAHGGVGTVAVSWMKRDSENEL